MASSTLCKYTTHVCTLFCTCKSIAIFRKVGPYISYTVKGEIKLENVATNMQCAIKCSGLIEQMSVGVCPHQHHHSM